MNMQMLFMAEKSWYLKTTALSGGKMRVMNWKGYSPKTGNVTIWYDTVGFEVDCDTQATLFVRNFKSFVMLGVCKYCRE